MRRKSILIGVVAVVVLALVALFEPTGVVRGYVRGEPFYAGRPASIWAKRLNDENPKAKDEAERSLKAGGPNAAPVLAAIMHASAEGWGSIPVRILAIDTAAELGPAGAAAVPALMDALADRDVTVRAHAALALGAIGPNDQVVVLALIDQLGTPNALAATKALSRGGATALAATPALVGLLKTDDVELRWNAIKTLGKIRAVDAMTPLIAALKDPADIVREHAAEALGDLGPAAGAAVEPLIAALKDPYFKARRDAARSLGQIGPAAKPAIPALQALAKDDPQGIVRDAAALAIKKLGD